MGIQIARKTLGKGYKAARTEGEGKLGRACRGREGEGRHQQAAHTSPGSRKLGGMKQESKRRGRKSAI